MKSRITRPRLTRGRPEARGAASKGQPRSPATTPATNGSTSVGKLRPTRQRLDSERYSGLKSEAMSPGRSDIVRQTQRIASIQFDRGSLPKTASQNSTENDTTDVHSSKHDDSGTNNVDGTTEDASRKRKAGTDDAVENDDSTANGPIREIAFKRYDSQSNGRNKKPHIDLDEATLQIVKDIASKRNFYDRLNDDEIMNTMTRMNKVSARQAEYQRTLMGESDDSDDSIFHEILATEEEYTTGHELFHSIMNDVRAETTETLDKKTLAWLKKAARLQRTSAEAQARQTAMEADTTRMMKTRTASRRSRAQKRQVGLTFLVDAIEELEKEQGPFEVIEREEMVEELMESESEQEQEPEPQVEMASLNGTKKRPLVATIIKQLVFGSGNTVISSTQVVLGRIYVNGEVFACDVNPRSSTTIDAEPGKRTIEKSKSLTRKTESSEPESSLVGPPWLKFQDVDVRLSTSVGESKARRLRHRLYTKVPERYKSDGITRRLPQWSSVVPNLCHAVIPARSRHSDSGYASMCSRLMNALKGRARTWAMAEFFYSDLDRGWYNRNTLLERAVKIGLGPNSKVTRKQWAAIRRMVSAKPRRFSKTFISSQLKERDAYRDAVRMIQRRSLDVAASVFPYDVPAPIRVGTVVSAYNRRYRMVQRGVALTYHENTSEYLVVFDDNRAGSLFCPDTDVATHGGATLLVSSQVNVVTNSEGSTAGFVSGSAKDPSTIVPPAKLSPVNEAQVMQQACRFVPSSNTGVAMAPKPVALPMREQVAEREMLGHIISVLQAATLRKKLLLDEIEKLDSMDAETNEEDRVWLLANLEETNETLNSALQHLRLLYGDLYLPSSTVVTDTESAIQKTLQDVARERGDVTDLSRQWAMQLACESRDAASRVLPLFKKSSDPDADSTFLEKQLCSVGQILFSSTYAQELGTKSTDHRPWVAAISTGLMSASDRLSEVPGTIAPSNDAYESAFKSRALAQADLKDALALLEAELAASTAVCHLENKETST